MSRKVASKAGSQAVFEHRVKEGDVVYMTIIKQARKSGKLNLSNRGLVSVPEKVWHISEMDDEERKHKNYSWDATDDEKWWEQTELTLLDLSSNRLVQIEAGIQNLSTLQSLNLHDNQLISLPSELCQLEQLRQLNLSHNKLPALPDCIYQLKNLRSLSVKGNCLTQLSEDLGNLNLLESLDLSGNQLVSLPTSVAYLSRLNNLNLSNNLLVKLPDEIGCMLGVRHLDLSNNKLKEVNSTLSGLSHLLQLNLNHNQLKQIPVLQSCQELKELHAADNYLVELNEEIFEPLPKLQLLDVRDNHISKLSDFIVNLQGLERLDLSNNDLNSLPQQLGFLPHLKSLSLEGNPLKTIRRDILQRGTVQLLKFLCTRSPDEETPNIAKDGKMGTLFTLPEIDIFALRKSRCLDLSNCKATEIPESYFKALAEAEATQINLSRNQLSQLPESIEIALKRVTELQLASNKLSSISPVIQSAKYLTFLDVSCNILDKLPDEIASLSELREIWLNGNKFTQLPPSLYKLKRLEIILASDNRIEVIDVGELQQLSMLATLNLQNNNIQHVPPELGNLVQLRCLQLEGNPFRHPRTAILAKGTNALLEYLRDRISK